MRVFHSMSTFSPDFIFWGETIFCLVTPETETRFTVKNIWCTKQPYMKKKNLHFYFSTKYEINSMAGFGPLVRDKNVSIEGGKSV